MTDFGLNKICAVEKKLPLSRQVINSCGILFFGLFMGIFSKWLDTAQPIWDLGNFFSRVAVWVLIAVCISMYSSSPVRAVLHAFLFFGTMLVGYFGYTKIILHFFPSQYMMYWAIIALLSPILAYICWYAKGDGVCSMVISATIIAELFTQAFSWGIFYFDISSILEVIVWLVGVLVLYKNPKQIAKVLGLSVVIAVVLRHLNIPFFY